MNAFFAIDNMAATRLALAGFLFAAGYLSYVYIGYPILLALLGLFVRRKTSDSGYTPFVSVLICAHNEQDCIARKIRESLALDYPPDLLEIIVASDGSTDRTDEIVSSIENPRVRLLRIEGRRGKTNAQNQAVKICRGEVIIFSDATAIYHPGVVRRLAAHFDDPHVAAVSGRYRYFEQHSASPSGFGSIAFWDYENLIKWLQSNIHSLTGCSGSIYSVRRSCYQPLPDEACSDLVEPLHLVRNGYRVLFEPRALAYEETTVNAQQEWRMRVRVATRGMDGVLSVSELLNPFRYPGAAFQLVSHKILRWLAPIFLMILFISSGFLWRVPAFRFFFLLQCCLYGVALLGAVFPLQRVWRPLAIPQYFCALNAAFAVGLVQVARGRKYTVWQPIRNPSKFDPGALQGTNVKS